MCYCSLGLLILCITIQCNVGLGQQDGDIRLMSSISINQGRVEVYQSGIWGTVCDDQFDINEAIVICKQLGFENGAEKATHRAFFGQGTGQIWMDGLQCTGTEDALYRCKFNGMGIHDCAHREDAGVVCKLNENESHKLLNVRLVCPPSSRNPHGKCNPCFEKKGCPILSDPNNVPGVQGIVEVNIDNKWYPISSEGWGLTEAKVVCGQLGYPYASRIPQLSEIWPTRKHHFCYNNIACNNPGAAFRRRLRKTVLDNIQCAGSESNITECYYKRATLQPSDNLNENVATVQCIYDEVKSDQCIDENDNTTEIVRLRAGALPWIGRVEVRKNGKWGTICDIGWDLKDAHVVCRSLGYGSAKKVFFRSVFGRGIGFVHYSNVRCTGGETSLANCPSTEQTRLQTEVTTYCNAHTGDVGVECNIPQKCNSKEESSRVTNNSFVEVKHTNSWGRVCAGSIDTNAAYVVCKENSRNFATIVKKSTDSTYSGIYYIGAIDCTGDELRLDECKIALNARSSCLDGLLVTVECSNNLPDLVPDVERFKQSLRYYPYVERLPMYYLTCAKEENCLASSANNQPATHIRTLLRFDSLTMNFGTAAFSPNQRREEWEWHSCHSHYHSFENFISYDVLDANGNKVAEGHKASFCLEDSYCSPGGYSQYRCSSGVQGISVNCGDLYARHLDCQWIDITGLQSGEYLVRQIVNADRLTSETDYKNNEIQCHIEIKQQYYLTVGDCTHSDH